MNLLKTVTRAFCKGKKYSTQPEKALSLLSTCIKERRSVRNYLPDKVPKEIIEEIIEAGIDAPSACNQQAIHYNVIQDQDLLKEISEYCVEHMDEYFYKIGIKDIFYDCPTVILMNYDVSAVPDFLGNEYAGMDIGHAAQNMELKAHSLGLSTCTVGLVEYGVDFIAEKLEAVEVEDVPLIAIALGYNASDKKMKGPKRKKVEDVSTWYI